MHTAAASRAEQPRRHRPSRVTVFTTAFVAGAAVAFGVNRVLDLHLAQARPQIECEPIFVALHSLPQGAPITVWDVALKDWPRAMLPASALRARDTFEGMVLRHPLREGQPLLSVQLMRSADSGPVRSAALPLGESFTSPLPATQTSQDAAAMAADLWTPAAPTAANVAAAGTPATSPTDVDPPPSAPRSTPLTVAAETFVAPPPASEPAVAAVGDSARVESAPPGSPVETSPEPAAEADPAADAAAREPTLAAVPEPAITSEPQPLAQPQPETRPEPAQPGLLAATEPLFAPVPASPPSDLDGPLAGVGQLPSSTPPPEAFPGPSILESTTSDAPAPTAPPQAAGRYLVVPERIALQADASFAAPAAVRPSTVAQRPEKHAAAETAARPMDRAGGAGGANGQRTGAKRPQRPQAAPGNGRQEATATPRPRSAMFPNLTAGIEALTGSQRKPAGASQPSSTTR